MREVRFRKQFKWLVLTTIKKVEVKSLLGKTKVDTHIQGVISADTLLEKDDILVLYGANKDLQVFLKQKL
ncbi:MAG: hypothetical protein PHQ74_14390 [Crocinitomicaceae bacterium]|nr:hypothetical protein [Crocinitomicaceae bacterium]